MKESRKKQILGFDDTWLIIIGIPAISLIMPLMLLQYEKGFTFDWYFTHVKISFIQTLVYWFVFRQIFMFTRVKLSAFSDTFQRISLQLVLVFVVYIILEPILGRICYWFIFNKANHPDGVALTVSTIVMITLWVAIYEGIYFYEQLKKSIQEREQLQRENIQSQLEGLKSQVNPHFLFNSLNTLSYLIPEDAEKSVKFVQKLSKVYRYILEMTEEELIPLHKELEFLNSYIFLLKERFEENLQVEIDIPEKRLKDQIIPLSLQILFENAIKHNIISSSKPLKVRVLIGKDNKLIVENNLQKKKIIRDSTKFGLQNIKNRYRILSDEAVDVISTSTSFIVSLPLINANAQMLDY